MMKIISWNVNGLRSVERKGALRKFEREFFPDFLFLQEIKGDKEQFSEYLTAHDNFIQYYHSAQKKGYAGSGIWVKKEIFTKLESVEFETDVPHLPAADEGRVSHLRFVYRGTKYALLSVYFPNGGKSEQAWRDKLIFYDRFLDYINRLHEKGEVVIFGGDLNVAHTEIDLARPKENDGQIGFHPDERAWVDRLIKAGWVDTFRSQHPDTKDAYTWWSHWARSRERNVGWRIDYFFVHRKFFPAVKNSFILSEVTGSDHCPVGIDWDEESAAPRAAVDLSE